MLFGAYLAIAAVLAFLAYAVGPLGLGWLAWALAVAAAAGAPLSLHERTFGAAVTLLHALAITMVSFFILVTISVQNCVSSSVAYAPLRHV